VNVREFNYLFFRDWNTAGGLITPSTAAKLLGVTRGRISQIWEERNLKKYIYNDVSKPLLSLNDVKKIQNERYVNLSAKAKNIIDEEQAKWEFEYKAYLENNPDEDPGANVTYTIESDENVTSEIENYEEYLDKQI